MAEAVVMVATLPSAVNTLVPVTPAGGWEGHRTGVWQGRRSKQFITITTTMTLDLAQLWRAAPRLCMVTGARAKEGSEAGW
jgi:hypothetical protein